MSNEPNPRIAVTKNGPYIVTGGVTLVRLAAAPERGSGGWRVEETLPPRQTYALCRCGRSKMKPFCDYTHLGGKFDGGEAADRIAATTVTGEEPDPRTSIGFVREAEGRGGGPLWLRGSIEVVSTDGFAYATAGRCALCRCGASRTKPFCDGSHAARGRREA